MIASSVLLLIVGVWLVTQTLVGDLPQRVLSWRNAAKKSSTNSAAEHNHA